MCQRSPAAICRASPDKSGTATRHKHPWTCVCTCDGRQHPLTGISMRIMRQFPRQLMNTARPLVESRVARNQMRYVILTRSSICGRMVARRRVCAGSPGTLRTANLAHHDLAPHQCACWAASPWCCLLLLTQTCQQCSCARMVQRLSRCGASQHNPAGQQTRQLASLPPLRVSEDAFDCTLPA